MTKRVRYGFVRGVGLWIVFFSLSTITHLRAEKVDDEFKFASGLVELGFPDLAQKVVNEILRLHPDQASRANLIKAQGLVAAGKFADAEALVSQMPANDSKTDAVRLALANGYFRYGNQDKAKELYNAFFQKYKQVPTDTDLLTFFRESAYRYAMILKDAGDFEGAVQGFNKLLSSKPERDIELRVKAEQAQLYIKLAGNASGEQKEKYLKSAQELAEQVTWVGADNPYFGHAIIAMAHIELARGDKVKAQKVIQDQMELLKGMDKLLKESGRASDSPFAGARFLLGDIIQQQADAVAKDPARKGEAIQLYGKALNEFYNVFVQYGDGDWGADAGARASTIKQILERDFGKQVKIDLGDMANKAAQTQFKLADNLYAQKKFAEAIKEYLKSLNQFPESDTSIRALGSLAMSYAQTDDKLMARAVAEYIGERFANKDNGAIALLSLGKYYFDRKNSEMYYAIYDFYVKSFPNHDRAPLILYTLAGLKKKEGDKVAAGDYFNRIMQNYPKSEYYPKALSQVAWTYYQAEQYDKAIEGFKKLVAETTPSYDQAFAQFSLADCYLRLGQYEQAAKELEVVMGWLGSAEKKKAYATTPEEAAKNQDLLGKAIFQRANCYARIKEPAEAVAAHRATALKTYETFVAIFPTSELAPKAMFGKGTIQLELSQFDAATKTFDELAAKYPLSDEGKNALYSLARSAMEIKQYDQAKAAFERMMQNAGKYKPEEFVRIGQLMIDASLFPQAIQAFQQVQATTQDRALLERALFGVGRAYFVEKQFEQAIKALEDLMTRYPKSGLFYDAKFLLGESYRETGKLNEATAALSDVFKYASDAALINRASFTLGGIQKQGGDLQGALASFQRIALLADPTNEELKPIMEQAILESIDVAFKLKRYQDVQESCDQYVKLFPGSDKIEEVRRQKADAKLKAIEEPAPATAG